MELISYDFWNIATKEKNRVPVTEQFDVLKNWISEFMRKLIRSEDASDIEKFYKIPYLPPDILHDTQFQKPAISIYEDQRCFDLDYMMRKENDENKIHVVMSNIQQFSNMSEARAQVMVEYITEWFQDREKVIAERETYIFELLKSKIALSNSRSEQKVMVTDENSTMSEVDTKTLKDLDVIMKKFNLNSICEVEEKIQESYRTDDALEKIVQIYQESQRELQELHAKFDATQHELRNLEEKLKMEQYDHKNAIAKYENALKCSNISDVEYCNKVTNGCELEVSKTLEDSCIESYGIDKEHTENDLEMDKVDQKAKDTNLGPPLNSNILENFQHCDSMSIVTTECSKTDYETEHETQIIDSPDIDYKNEDTDAIHKESTQMRSFTIQENSCDNENDKIEHITHESLNNQIQKAGLQKPGDVACGGFFDKKMKRRVNEEMRPRTDPPTDLSQQSCYGTVSDMLDWNNWSHENWKDMSWQRFVRESRPRKDPPWSSCRSEVDMCYGWRWDVSQVPSRSQDWRSRHVLFTPRQAAEVQ